MAFKKKKRESKSLAALRKEHADDLEDPIVNDNIEVIPSGSLVIDTLTGIGGYPCGRVTELWGDEGVSKTTLALLAAAQTQKMGKAVAFFDFEDGFCNPYATRLGVDIYDKDTFYLFRKQSFEEAEPKLWDFAQAENVGLVVLDSITSMTPEDYLEGGNAIGLLARNLSKFFGGYVKALSRSGVACLATNQGRMKIATSKYERTTEESTGGKALKYYSSIRIRLRPRKKHLAKVPNLITGIPEDEAVKVLVGAETLKNRFFKPFKRGNYWIRYGAGVDNGATIFDMASAGDLFMQSGSWVIFQFPWDGKPSGKFKVQGIDKVRDMVSSDASLQKSLIDVLKGSNKHLKLESFDPVASAAFGDNLIEADSEENVVDLEDDD